MRLLFDENLPPSLAHRLEDVLPGSVSAQYLGLGGRPDAEVWEAARAQGLTIATKDKGYLDMALERGHPPRVVLIRLGNVPTPALENLIRANLGALKRQHDLEYGRAILLLPGP